MHCIPASAFYDIFTQLSVYSFFVLEYIMSSFLQKQEKKFIKKNWIDMSKKKLRNEKDWLWARPFIHPLPPSQISTRYGKFKMLDG